MTDLDPCRLAGTVVGPATRMLWRGPDQLHLELGGDAMVVEGLPEHVVHAIAGRGPARVAAEDIEGPVAQALGLLVEGGYLWPAAPAAALAPTRLVGEVRGLAVGQGRHAPAVVAGRRAAGVEVEGTNRAAVHLAAVLAAAGVGRIRCTGTGEVRLAHAIPGGLCPADEGTVRSAAADAAIRRAAPDHDGAPITAPDRPDLVVLALDGVAAAPTPERRDALHAGGTPYLCVVLDADRAAVGPLVLPGLTSCVRCADLLRTDRDPAWPALQAQLSIPPRYGPAADGVVATTAVGLAAAQALAFLDGENPATIDGTLHVEVGEWRVRRRSWTVHPDCDCMSAPP
jgi:bacteriocin biosynthesis cyclodehydratase domain-containing protein